MMDLVLDQRLLISKKEFLLSTFRSFMGLMAFVNLKLEFIFLESLLLTCHLLSLLPCRLLQVFRPCKGWTHSLVIVVGSIRQRTVRPFTWKYQHCVDWKLSYSSFDQLDGYHGCCWELLSLPGCYTLLVILFWPAGRMFSFLNEEANDT